jgi:hypothetical protein
MSMSTDVIGFHPPDEVWKQMKAVWDACEQAGVEPPDRVLEFFDHEKPDSAGVTVDLRNSLAVKEYRDDQSEGYEVDLDQLPPDVTIIRFVNSW